MDTPGHVDYPHEVGTLYDCYACESECYCDEDLSCLHCSLTDRQMEYMPPE